jgi:hypothetical protein
VIYKSLKETSINYKKFAQRQMHTIVFAEDTKDIVSCKLKLITPNQIMVDVKGKINVGPNFYYFMQFSNLDLLVISSQINVDLSRVDRLDQLTPLM